MTRYKAISQVLVPDPADPLNPRAATRFLKQEIFEAEPPTREVKGPSFGTMDWLDWAVFVGALVVTDEPTTGPGLPYAAAFPPTPRYQGDGTTAEPDPSTEVIED